MTIDELTTIFDQCRQRATRLGIVLGSFGVLGGVVGIALNVVRNQGGLSRDNFLIVSCLILLLCIVVFFWGLRNIRLIPANCGALCPKCGTSLITQRDKVLSTGSCGECNNNIIERPNEEDAPDLKPVR